MSRIVIDARKLADFGIGTYVRGLLGGLAEIDVRHEYRLLGDPGALDALALPDRFAAVEERSPLYSLRELVAVGRTARRLGADLLHVPHYVVPFGAGCPIVVTVHDLIHLRFPDLFGPLARLYARIQLGRAAARPVLAVSRATRDEIVERFGARDVSIVPNGVDERFRGRGSAAETAAVLARLGLAPGYLLFAGNPKPHKNLDLLLDAHRRLRGGPGATPSLVVAGGPAPSSGGDPAVVRLGRVAEADLPALFRGASIVVVPSRWEGFGLPALEAMACGTAVVAARAGALPEVVGDAGVLVDPDDPAALAAALRGLLDDDAARAALAARGEARAAELTWTATARATLAVYERVLGARSAA